MIPFAALGIAVLIPGAVVAADELQTWSDAQLCRARDIPEALDELERRDIFSRHEIRAIRRDEVWDGISEDALRCMKGSPQMIVPAVTIVEGDTVDGFVYPQNTLDSLIVYIRRAGDVSTVAAAFTTSEGRHISGASSYANGNDRQGISRDGQRIYHLSDPTNGFVFPPSQ